MASGPPITPKALTHRDTMLVVLGVLLLVWAY
jgi:hypothetical protein